jgi:hypothetical protein
MSNEKERNRTIYLLLAFPSVCMARVSYWHVYTQEYRVEGLQGKKRNRIEPVSERNRMRECVCVRERERERDRERERERKGEKSETLKDSERKWEVERRTANRGVDMYL